MRKLFFFVFLFILSAANIIAQHSLRGKVIDENGSAIADATVQISNQNLARISDAEGNFEFSGIPFSKAFSLKVSIIGYETTIAKASTENFNVIKLKKKEYAIDEVTVVSLRATDRSPVTYTNVNKDELQRVNLGQDISWLLAQTPAFVATSESGTGVGNTGFRIRGTDFNRINVTVNGVPLNEAESHAVYFVNMPDFVSSVSSVQIQRGAGTSTNGAAAFGANVNIQTEKFNPKAYAEVSSSYGSFNTNKNTLRLGTGLLNDMFAIDARLSSITSDGYVDRATANMQSYYFSAGYYGENSSLKFLTFGGREKTGLSYNGVDSEIMKTNRTYNDLGEFVGNDGETKYYDNETDNYNQTHYQLHFVQQFNKELNLSATAHYTRGLGFYENYKANARYTDYMITPDTINGVAQSRTDIVRQKLLDNHFYGVNAALNYETNKWRASVGGAVNHYNNYHFGKVIGVRNAQNLDRSKLWYENTTNKTDANIYAKLNAQMIENLYGYVDLQYRFIHFAMDGRDDTYDKDNKEMHDITTTVPFHFFNPKFGATYNINSQNSVYASFSVANREPNRDNYTERGKDTPDPLHETLYDTELGYHFKSENFTGSANLYYMKYKNQLILTGKVSDIGEPLTSNIPDSYRTGLELVVGWKITNWLKWSGNATFSSNKILNFVEEDVEMYDNDNDWNFVGLHRDSLGTTDIAYSPNVLVGSVFTFNYKNFEAGLLSNFVGRQYFDNTSNKNRSIDPYFVNNLSLKYTFKPKKISGIDLQLLVNNLFNAQYSNNAYTWYSCYFGNERHNEIRFFPQAGINFLAGITFRF
jgi:Outer membrane receptor proteins, mostly Fe transport